MKRMQSPSIYGNGGKMPSEQLQNVTMEVGVEDDEGKEGVENEDAPSKHHLPRSFASDTFKVPSARTCYNCICTEIMHLILMRMACLHDPPVVDAFATMKFRLYCGK